MFGKCAELASAQTNNNDAYLKLMVHQTGRCLGRGAAPG
jgi:hypothetical protein